MQSEPRHARTAVWALSISLAATLEIDFSFFSSGYLDVSVHRVPSTKLWIHFVVHEVCSCRFPHSDTCGSMDICSSPQLFAAYHVFRRLSVPRHPPCALPCLTCFPAFCWCRIHSVVCSGFGFYAYSLLSCFLLITGLVSLSWLPRMSLLCFRYFRFLCIRFSRNSLPGLSPMLFSCHAAIQSTYHLFMITALVTVCPAITIFIYFILVFLF